MALFNYTELPAELTSLALAHTLETLHEHEYLNTALASLSSTQLNDIREEVMAQSAHAMAQIEGEDIDDTILADLIAGRAQPKGGIQAAATGYVYIRDLIENRYRTMAVSPGVIMQLHRDYHFFGTQPRGRWRKNNEVTVAGCEVVLSWENIPQCMRDLCHAYAAGTAAATHDALILATMFTCDFLRIAPFPSDTMRLAFLLLHELLLKAGWNIVIYGCLEAHLAATKEEGKAALAESLHGWPRKSSYLPFVSYLLAAFDATFRTLEANQKLFCQTSEVRTQPYRTQPYRPNRPCQTQTPYAKPAADATLLKTQDDPCALTRAQSCNTHKAPVISENEKILRAYFATITEPVSKVQIVAANPSISKKTIERILQKMQKDETIERVGTARATRYQRIPKSS